MNRFLTAAGAAALLAVSAFPALADEVTGAITAVDPAAHTVTLDDGKAYVMPAEMDLTNFQIGLNVTLTYDEANDVRTVTAVSSPG